MRRAVQDALRQAWHGPETDVEIGKRVGISARHARRFWLDEKRAGRLPDHARPHFAKFTSAPSIVGDWSDDADAEIDTDLDEADGAPDDFECRINRRTHDANRAACDASLAALISAHGGDPWIGSAHIMPAQTLQMEANGYPPCASRLRQFNRVRDTVMRALMKRRDARQAKEVGYGG